MEPELLKSACAVAARARRKTQATSVVVSLRPAHGTPAWPFDRRALLPRARDPIAQQAMFGLPV